MEWADLYSRLVADPDEATSWAALESHVRYWARRDLSGRAWQLAEDVVADTCAAVLIGIGNARGGWTFAGFVKGHYLNVRRQAIRAVKPQQDLTDVDVAAPPTLEATSDQADALRRCLARLAERERKAVELRYFEDAAATQIAEALDITEGNARRVVFNGLAHLRACVRNDSGAALP